MTEESRPLSLPEISGIVPSPGDGPIWFVACDTGYAIDHLVPFAKSLDTHEGPVRDLHVHVVNPGDGLGDAVAALAADLSHTRITMTAETVDLSPLSAEGTVTYYAAIRFVRAASFVDALKRPVFVTDIDSIVRRLYEFPSCEVGLFVRDDHPKHMSVAAGAVLFTPEGRNFAWAVGNAIGRELAKALAGQREIGWYIDQFALAEAVEVLKPDVHRFDQSLLDWEFTPESAIWTGKGQRKRNNKAYLKARAAYEGDFKIDAIRKRFWGGADGKRALILLPALDLPFKRPRGVVQEGGTIAPVRVPWMRFADDLEEKLCAFGWNARILCRPQWELTPTLADMYGADVVFVPHRERHQFPCRTQALYYMQTPLGDWFTVDRGGWGAGCSDYPFIVRGEAENGAFDALRERLDANVSKFEQPDRLSRLELIERDLIPDGPYVFFPCQIPHDETILFHSNVQVVDAVRAVADWANESGHNVVFKPHPVNPASMEPLRQAAPATGRVRWSEASIHDLIAHSEAVFTVNSGAGMEALLHGKPVITFGRAEYDAVAYAIRPTIQDIADAHAIVLTWPDNQRLESYRRFFDWFCNRHAFKADAIDAERLLAVIDGRVEMFEVA